MKDTLHFSGFKNGKAIYENIGDGSIKGVVVEWDITETLPRFVKVEVVAVKGNGDPL